MPINAHPDYLSAEKAYLQAETIEEKIKALEKMLSYVPKHKGAENLRAQLRTRYKKLKEKLNKKSKKFSSKGIRKENYQIVVLGKTNSGKSTFLSLLTNAKPMISEINFTTKKPEIGIINIESVNMQLIENPSIESEYYDKGLTNSADILILLITSLDELQEITPLLNKATNKQIIIYNLKQDLSANQKRKLSEKMKTKKLNFLILNLRNITKEEINLFKNKVFEFFDKIRIYTKEPNKKEKSEKPIILNENATLEDVAEKILKGFSKQIKFAKIWGPSSKFPGQIVGLKHKLKDMDIVEFKTK